MNQFRRLGRIIAQSLKWWLGVMGWTFGLLFILLVAWGVFILTPFAIFDIQPGVDSILDFTWRVLGEVSEWAWLPNFIQDHLVRLCAGLPDSIDVTGSPNEDGKLFDLWVTWAWLLFYAWLLAGFILLALTMLAIPFRWLFGANPAPRTVVVVPATTTATTATATTAAATAPAGAPVVISRAPRNREDNYKLLLLMFGLPFSIWLFSAVLGKVGWNFTYKLDQWLHHPETRTQAPPSRWDGFGDSFQFFLVTAFAIGLLIYLWSKSVGFGRTVNGGAGAGSWSIQALLATLFLVILSTLLVVWGVKFASQHLGF